MSTGIDEVPNEAQVITRALDLRLARTYVMRVGRIEKFYADTQLADVKPLLMNEYTDKTGERKAVSVPVLPNVPVAFLGGANGLDTYPVAKGDECMLLFADRSLDRWIEYGDEQDPGRTPHHDVTDAIAIVGVRSKPKKLTEFDENRKVIAHSVGAPRVAMTSSEIHLGVDHNENATDWVALANKTKQEIQALRDTVNALVTTMNTNTVLLKTHTHEVVLNTLLATPSSVLGGGLQSGTAPAAVQDIKSAKVRCK